MPWIRFPTPIGRACEARPGCLELWATGGPSLKDARSRSAVRAGPRVLGRRWRPVSAAARARQQACSLETCWVAMGVWRRP
ncbi:hypothetical protein NDU88_003513 [Pleurodeles waltl]|uniref:Uncharacterized protein n=1 Tax=Pleurodeles waltl TaxID=8319 RepID=A0AAV7UCT9_PLEWA|nr:hypothetical protein NDU88_003513 [Pleurodeles waltl]